MSEAKFRAGQRVVHCSRSEAFPAHYRAMVIESRCSAECTEYRIAIAGKEEWVHEYSLGDDSIGAKRLPGACAPSSCAHYGECDGCEHAAERAAYLAERTSLAKAGAAESHARIIASMGWTPETWAAEVARCKELVDENCATNQSSPLEQIEMAMPDLQHLPPTPGAAKFDVSLYSGIPQMRKIVEWIMANGEFASAPAGKWTASEAYDTGEVWVVVSKDSDLRAVVVANAIKRWKFRWCTVDIDKEWKRASVCGYCGRRLSADASIDRGCGDICYKKAGMKSPEQSLLDFCKHLPALGG